MVRPSTQPSSRRRAAKAAAHGAKPEALAPKNPTVGSLADCCAETVAGHASVAQNISAMNSRRRMPPPSLRTQHRSGPDEARQEATDVRFGSKADICTAK